jgi:S1-C subfamily serine protease
VFADAVARIKESIFPIFYIHHEDNLAGVCGTGWFIGDDGLFLTSDHVMGSPPPGSALYFYGPAPDAVCDPAVELEHVWSDASVDLYLGRVRRDALPGAEIADERIRPGDWVCLSGYPFTDVKVGPRGGLVGSVRRHWQPSFVVDEMDVVIQGRTYSGYIVEHPCYPGMSGAPVFDAAGRVRGMVGANLSRTIPPLPDDPPTVVANGIVIDVAHIREFLAAARPAPPALLESL